MNCYLGVDIGTYETKGVLVDATGEILASAARPHRMLVPRPGWAEHDPDADWWGDFVHVTGRILAKTKIDPHAIKAVGVSAIGPCMLPVDAGGRPLMNGVLYGVDTRASEEVEELTGQIGIDKLIAECGNALTSQAVGPKILWLRRKHPDIFARTAKILTSTSYLVMKLTGACVMDHYTAANFTPLYSLSGQGWSGDHAREIIEPERLPEIRWSTEIVGEVTRAAAEETGLAPGTPVTCGTIDAAAEAVSVGVTHPGEMMMMYGSTIFIIMVTGNRIADSRLWYAPWLFESQHASMAGLATSGTLTHWFRDQLARDLPREDGFAALVGEAAASPPGARGLVMLPYFSGERTPIQDPHAKGIIFGLDLTHTRGDIFRAAIEGIALGTRHVIDTWRGIGATPDRIYAVGGGTKNQVWTQATSDATGIAQVLRKRTIGASYGDAFLAALATGAAQVSDIDEWNPVVGEIVPLAENGEVLDERFKVFRALYEQTRDLLKRE